MYVGLAFDLDYRPLSTNQDPLQILLHPSEYKWRDSRFTGAYYAHGVCGTRCLMNFDIHVISYIIFTVKNCYKTYLTATGILCSTTCESRALAVLRKSQPLKPTSPP